MSWPTANFLDVVKDVSGGNVKIPQSDFIKAGKIPVIDQGKEFIAGFTNNQDARFKSSELPVVIFGDHTKAIKYIDFPFAMGADGVKVLSVKDGLDSKFFYHYLRQSKIPDAGYSRHYKFLKELKIPLPPIEEQHRIAAILDKAETLRAKRREAIGKLDQLLQSVFLEMFGDPVSNPKKWDLRKIKDLCSEVTVGIVVKPASYYVDQGVPAIRSLNIGENYIKKENFVYFSHEDNSTTLRKTILRAGDIVVVRSGQPGKAAVIPKELDGINAIDVLIARPNKNKIIPDYLSFFINSSAGKRIVLSEQRGQVQKHLNVKQLGEAHIPLPNIDLQIKFLDRINNIYKMRKKSLKHLSKIDNLINSLNKEFF